MKTLTIKLSVLLLIAANSANAGGFKTPSGNIECEIGTSDEYQVPEIVLQCLIRSVTIGTIGNCGIDSQRVFTLWQSLDEADSDWSMSCGGIRTENQLPVLKYGDEWKEAGFTCKSQKNGLECKNNGGKGFFLSKNKQETFP